MRAVQTLRRGVAGWVAALISLMMLRAPHMAPAQSGTEARRSVDDRLAEFGAEAKSRLLPAFEASGVAWPPARFAFLGFKHENTLELWAANREGPFQWVKTYIVRAASGRLGPKLRQGDLQVPEGIYRIESLNPNSKYHVSLRLNYPNAFDRSYAAKEGRKDPGGDIMIHGRAVSVGCLAMGDPGAEELFLVAAKSGIAAGEVILSPVDFRVRDIPPDSDRVRVAWEDELYASIREALKRFRYE